MCDDLSTSFFSLFWLFFLIITSQHIFSSTKKASLLQTFLVFLYPSGAYKTKIIAILLPRLSISVRKTQKTTVIERTEVVF